MSKSLKRVISLILSIVIAFGANLIAVAENENHWKNKIDAKIYEEATDKDRKVPVYIWLTDVDHNEVVEKTENTLGYGEKDLEIIDENISEELAIAISGLSEKEDDSVADELQKYMKKTAKKRKAEKEKTDKYISEKRSNYKDEYNKKSKDFLEKAKIYDDIIFRSQYAPMIIAELTIKQIEKVAKSDEVTDISLYKEIAEEPQTVTSTMDEVKSSTNIDKIHDIGLTGAGVKVGVYDFGNFSAENSELNANRVFENIESAKDSSYADNADTNHINNVIKYGFGKNGIANEAYVYIVGSSYFGYEDFENLLSKGIQIINHSTTNSQNGLLYDNDVKWIEHITNQHNVSFVQSAGNKGNNIRKPGLAYNVITVGGYNNNATYSSSDDTIFSGSCYINTGYCEKPDVLANAYAFGKYGTSFSAPFVSGLIALMLELRPSLAAYPQVVKAILLASCHHKATSSPTETISQGITDKQGAGVVDAYRAISITGRGNYVIREIGSGVTNTDIKFNVPKLYGASGINISIAWLKNNTVSSSPHHLHAASNSNIHNLNLSVLSGSTVVGTSTKSNSSTEMVYISNPTANTTYTAQITKADNVNTSVKIAYAWAFDEEQFQYTSDNEGVFFLKNKQSGNYLHYSNTLISQKPFVGSFYQQVIVQMRNNGKYTLNNFIGNTGCYDVGEPISGKYFAVSYNSDNTDDMSVQNNVDGSVTLSKIINSQQYVLSVLNNSTAEDAQVVWKRIDSATDIESGIFWYLEPVCYQVGDVDMDGQIEAEDSRTVLNYSSGNGTLGSDTFINILTYLADANSDGVVNATDARLILRFSAGLE